LRDSTGVNLDALVIDYLGILKPPRYAINYNSYERYRSITVELNAIASMLNVANISAIQLKASTDDNSGQGKKFTDIADSTGIAQPAQYVFAIVQSDTDYLNRQYQIECMKARGSNKLVTGEFKVDYEHWRLIDTKRVRDIGAVSLDIEDEPTEVVSVQDLSLESFMENG
jgi:replicative DNA helicase